MRTGRAGIGRGPGRGRPQPSRATQIRAYRGVTGTEKWRPEGGNSVAGAPLRLEQQRRHIHTIDGHGRNGEQSGVGGGAAVLGRLFRASRAARASRALRAGILFFA